MLIVAATEKGNSMAFKMKVEHEVTIEEATAAADVIERAVGEVCNGKRKPGSIPTQEMFTLVQFARDSANRANAKLPGPAGVRAE